MKYFICFILFALNAFASLPIAEVLIVRGKATMLRPGAFTAYEVKKDDKILEDSSIITYEKSFVRLKFIDETIVNVGPNSKIRIAEFSQGEPGVIDLLRGRLRTSVQKAQGSDANKFYVKTRTAAMAVRGTEFQTTYNPENKNTSLLTYIGEVAMIKINDEEIAQKQVAVQEVSGQVAKEVSVENTMHDLETANGLQKVMDAKKAALVITKAGQYSGSVPGLTKATIPVKISPVQFASLYKNEMLEDKMAGDKVKMAEASTANNLAQADQTTPPEGFLNRHKGDYAPRAGGFVDARTSLYIPPAEGSVLDEKSGVFIAQGTGHIDGDSGQYIAPKGIKLDAEKGFIIYGEEENATLLAQTEALNKDLKSDIVLVKPAESFTGYESSELLLGHDIIFEYRKYSEELKYSQDSVRGPRTFKTSSARDLKLDWEQASTSKWKTHLFGAEKEINLTETNGEVGLQGSRSLIRIGAGVQFLLSPSWTFKTDLSIDQNFFLNYTGGETQMVKVAMTKLLLGLEWKIYERKRWTSNIGFGVLLNPAKETGTLTVASGVGTDLNFNIKYWWGSHWRSSFGLWMISQSNQSTNTTGFSGNSDRSQSGLNIALLYHF